MNSKKTKARVQGDIFPQTVKKAANELALPLHHIYHQVMRTGDWPSAWTTETVTLIPKKKSPQSLGDLRNLSCTPLFSKILEGFVLEEIRKDVALAYQQFGGLKGSGCDHYLVETWDAIMTALENPTSAANLVSVDLEKAFNRMDFGECIKSLREHGAREEVVSMVSAFLTGRTMQVKVGNTLSGKLPVSGGAPQGSILANTLFCVTTDRFSSLATEHGTWEENELQPEEDQLTRTPPSSPNPIPHQYRTQSDNDNAEHDSSDDELNLGFGWRRQANPLDDTIPLMEVDRDEFDRNVGAPSQWRSRKIKAKVYVDDLTLIEKIDQRESTCHISQNKRIVDIHARKSEDYFLTMETTAEDIGMRVNPTKTALLCVNANYDDELHSYINHRGAKIESSPEMKLLGFWFSDRPNVSLHVEKMVAKSRTGIWSLRELKRAGMPSHDMLFIYKTIVRPILEYTVPS